MITHEGSQRIGVIVNDSSRVDATGIEEKPNAGEDDVQFPMKSLGPEFFCARLKGTV